jgi:protein TonB
MGVLPSPKSANHDVVVLDADDQQGNLPSAELDKTETGALKHNKSVRWDDDLSVARQGTGDAIPTPVLSLFADVKRQHSTQEFRVPAATMANDLQTQPNTEAQTLVESNQAVELDALFGAAVEEKSTIVDLYENLRDIFFPPKLPPLELTSTPIPVPDRMKVKANPWAVGAAAIVNGALLALFIFLGVKSIIQQHKKDEIVTPIDVKTDFKPPKALTAAGGGGGSPDKVEAIKGRIPPKAPPSVVVPKIIQPPTPTIDVQQDIKIPDNPNLPNFGMTNSPNVKLASSGNGTGMGMGNGHGSGYGDGTGGNIGGGVYTPGGAISAPELTYSIEPEFSDEARKAKYQGVVTISLIVDAQGNPQNVHVSRPLGMGLDEKAIEAVQKYRFKPGKKDGKAVATYAYIEVNFHLY